MLLQATTNGKPARRARSRTNLMGAVARLALEYHERVVSVKGGCASRTAKLGAECNACK